MYNLLKNVTLVVFLLVNVGNFPYHTGMQLIQGLFRAKASLYYFKQFRAVLEIITVLRI